MSGGASFYRCYRWSAAIAPQKTYYGDTSRRFYPKKGVDTAGDPCGDVICPSSMSNACHTGVCYLGTCSSVRKMVGAPCTDGNPYTVNDTCTSAGVCSGKDPCDGHTCPASTQVCRVNRCISSSDSGKVGTPQCKEVFLPDGTSCDDLNENTTHSACRYVEIQFNLPNK